MIYKLRYKNGTKLSRLIKIQLFRTLAAWKYGLPGSNCSVYPLTAWTYGHPGI